MMMISKTNNRMGKRNNNKMRMKMMKRMCTQFSQFFQATRNLVKKFDHLSWRLLKRKIFLRTLQLFWRIIIPVSFWMKDWPICQHLWWIVLSKYLRRKCLNSRQETEQNTTKCFRDFCWTSVRSNSRENSSLRSWFTVNSKISRCASAQWFGGLARRTTLTRRGQTCAISTISSRHSSICKE